MSATTPAASPTQLFARFSRRLRGIVIDWIIAMVVLFGAVMLASATGNSDVSRSLGYLVIAFLLLYEPVLVTLTGGTLGHWFSNLRVVDDRTGGNVSFPKALARLLIKGVLSWYSFVILAATRRNQAVHDLLTRSTVQIRDPARARSGQYVTERAEPAEGSMPSRLRRSVVTMLYVALALAAYFVMVGTLIVAGMLSERASTRISVQPENAPSLPRAPSGRCCCSQASSRWAGRVGCPGRSGARASYSERPNTPPVSQALPRKIFRFSESQISAMTRTSHPARGGSRSSRTARWDAMDAVALIDEWCAWRTAKSCGPCV